MRAMDGLLKALNDTMSQWYVIGECDGQVMFGRLIQTLGGWCIVTGYGENESHHDFTNADVADVDGNLITFGERLPKRRER